MKKSTIDGLSESEKETLALFHDTPAHKAIEKFCALELKALGSDALQAPDMDTLRRVQGKSMWVLDFIKMLDDIYKQNGWYSLRRKPTPSWAITSYAGLKDKLKEL